MSNQASYVNTITFGGNPNPPGFSTTTEAWNGSSWTETGDMSTGRLRGGGSGATSSAALCFGGAITGPGSTSATEEFTAADFEIKTMTTS